MRWRVLAVFVVMGAILGLGSTLLEQEDTGPAEIYWSSTHTVIVNSEAANQGRFPNLLQTALRVTAGEVPAVVANELGLDETELKSKLRTVTDLEVTSIDIGAVSTDREEARLITDTAAAALIEFLSREDKAAYDLSVTEAQTEVDTVAVALDELETRITTLTAEIAAAAAAPQDPDAPQAEPAPGTIDPAEELRLARIEQDTRFTIFQDAIARLDRLNAQGEPQSVLETLDSIPPFQISASEYNTRIRQGRQGDNNFGSRDLVEASGGGINLAQTVSSPAVRGALGAVAGLVLGIGAIILYLRFDPRLRTKVEIEDAFDLPVLAEIPLFDRKDNPMELHSVTRSRSIVTEAYRMVRSALLFARNTTAPAPDGSLDIDDLDLDLGAEADDDSDVRVVMVTSPGPAEGKTTTAANLAVVLAETGYEVLVINCDYRLPKLHKFFDIGYQPRKTVETDIPGVTVIADVTPDAAENPTSVVEAQRRLIAKARNRFDVVLLDTAPILATNDALGVLGSVDLVVLVCQEGKTDREAAEECAELLRRRRAKVAGVVVTGSTGWGRSRYYYKYRYGNYYTEAEKLESERRASQIDDTKRLTGQL